MPLTTLALAAALTLAQQEPPELHVRELLHLPRQDGVVLTVVPAEPVEAFVEYGRFPDLLRSTDVQLAEADELLTFDLDGLRPGGDYEYRVQLRAQGTSEWVPREVYAFGTLPAPGRRTRFAVLGDTHAYAVWSTQGLTVFGFPDPWYTLRATMEQLELGAPDLDFCVVGTDTAMTKCKKCEAETTPWGPTQEGSAVDVADAVARYRKVLAKNMLGGPGAVLPLLFGLGDHDGELGWSPDVLDLSRQARLANLPDPGYWFAWRSGDALLIMLNVHIATPLQPTAPEHWTLGADQLAWLEQTLAESDAPTKIVMAEHVLGGHDEGVTPLWKGRGALRATDTGLPDGTFLGEQAVVHELMVEHGVDLWLSFHDHVVAHGVKDGVTYLVGGRASGIQNPWVDDDWYRQAMDWDLDGVPEYETDVTGTVAPGWFRITVEGARGVAEYVLSDEEDDDLNGQVLLTFPFGG